jgi:hypothetical protein
VDVDRKQLDELHYITAVENVPSILERGLLSHRLAQKVKHTSVAMQQIQSIRSGKQIPGGRPLHDYVNLYINGRNVMMSKVLYGTSVDEICLLRISTDVLDVPGAVVSDQNAASSYALFTPAPEGLARIDKDYVFAPSWKHPDDQIAEWRHKSAMCAEVLVPDAIAANCVLGAYVGSHTGLSVLRKLADGLAAAVDAAKFLR